MKERMIRMSNRGNAVYWGLAAASCAHVLEEYVWPGGFLEAARELEPRLFKHATTPIVVGVNASMIVGCLGGALLAQRSPFLGLSMASLLHVNALFHLGASLRMKRYVPGMVTGLALYLPLSLKAFASYRRSDSYRWWEALGAAVLGLVWHSVPFFAFALRSRLRGTDKED